MGLTDFRGFGAGGCRYYKRKYKETGGKNIPEARLYIALYLGWTLPGGLFIVSLSFQLPFQSYQ